MKLRLPATIALLLAATAHPQAPEPKTVRIAVLTLFHPATLTLAPSHPITAHLDGTPTSLSQPIVLKAEADTLTAANQTATTLTLPLTTFTLTVEGKHSGRLTRTYTAALTITAHEGVLTPILTLDPEVAVASIVAAESPPNAPIEALKAQAVASRSFLLANLHAHPTYDACDTTHCQFLRSPPPPTSPAALATRATAHQVLTWRADPATPARIVPAMYSRSCGGHTQPHPSADPTAYPFYAVTCAFCLRHPQRTGHGIGLCQLGSADLAAKGEDFTRILVHFYPNTTLVTLP